MSNLNDLLGDLVIANEYNLKKSIASFMNQKPSFTKGKDLDINLLVAYISSSLPEAIKYELVKNSVKAFFEDTKIEDEDVENSGPVFSSRTSSGGFGGFGGSYSSYTEVHKPIRIVVGKVELECILNFFDLIFYDDNVVDLSPKQKSYLEILPFEYDTQNSIPKITCDEDFEGRVTLIVEGHKIHVKSFILTDNSPVFKAMLQSTSFKEGQTKTIELPGKRLDEIVYFLEFCKNSRKVVDCKFILILHVSREPFIY